MTDVRGRDFYQYRQPFELPDEATTPDGRTFRGARARVYWLLRITRERGYCHPVGAATGPPGTVPRFLLVEPWSGGSSGDRRARELREYGCEIRIENFAGPQGETDTTLYSLSRDAIAEGPSTHHRDSDDGPRADSRPPHGPRRMDGARSSPAVRPPGSSDARHPGDRNPHGADGAGRAASSADPLPPNQEACRRACEGRTWYAAVVDVDDAYALLQEIESGDRPRGVGWIYPQPPGDPSLCPQGCSAAQAYRAQLLRLYRAGKLARLLEGQADHLIAITPAHLRRLGFDPLEVLARAIESFGGRVRYVEVSSCVAS